VAKIVIIIPTYNEIGSVPKMVEALSRVIPTVKNHTLEVLYVDDSSPDGTAAAIKKLQPDRPWLHLLAGGKKQGLGVAYSRGMLYAMKLMHADFLMEFDGDFQHPPEVIPQLIAQIDHGYDFILGSRYIKGGSIPKEWSFYRKFLSVVGNVVGRIGLLTPGIHDVTGGFRLSRVRGFMDEFNFDTLVSKSFAYKIHLLFYMVQKGARVKEVPFRFSPRTSGESKIFKNEMLETLRTIFVLQMHNPKILKFFKFGIVGGVGFVINFFGLKLFNQIYKNIPVSIGVINFFANATAAELAIISNFIFNNLWTFSSEKITTVSELRSKFITFNVSSIVGGILVPSLIIGIGTQIFGDQYRSLFLVLAVFGFTLPYNWFIYNKFIWKAKAVVSSRQSK
jgi:dolichol-phosphate mannosyltransferase